MSLTKIRGLTIVSKPYPNRRGRTIIAHFDCAAGQFELWGCALYREPDGSLNVSPPRFETPGGSLRRVSFADQELRRDVKDRALSAYLALGGEHHEGPLPEPQAAPIRQDADDPDAGLRRVLNH